jgi:hypothetical protein
MLNSKLNPEPTSAPAPLENRFSTSDVVEILGDRLWLTGEPSPEQSAWCARAAALLGPHSPDRAALASLLSLIFCYDAEEILSTLDAQIVMSRYAARDVLRALANLLLDPAALTTEHFREIVEALKTQLDVRGRVLFHPLRLVLSGRSGEGELDRVVLLLEEGAAAGFSVPVKTARSRIIEFCSALD